MLQEALSSEQRRKPGKGRKPRKNVLARNHVDQGAEFPWDVGARGEHPVSLHHSLVEGCSQFFWNL